MAEAAAGHTDTGETKGRHAEPGWYPDPDYPGHSRHWDGTSWTEHRSPWMEGAPRGLYPDPGGGPVWRWWNGTQWTQDIQDEAEVQTKSAAADESRARGKTGMVAAAPVADVKGAIKALERAVKSHRERVEAAARELAVIRGEYSQAVNAGRQRVALATANNKLGAIGVVRRVTLYELSIKTPEGEFPLTPAVTASAEQHGNKQVVQGWVFKSDQDRREIFLHLKGPTWGAVVPFSLKNSMSTSAELHRFANLVTVAAANSDDVRRSKEEGLQGGQAALIEALPRREALGEAAQKVLSVAKDQQDVDAAATHLEGLLQPAVDDRRSRKARQRLDELRARAKGLPARGDLAISSEQTDSAAAKAELEKIRVELAGKDTEQDPQQPPTRSLDAPAHETSDQLPSAEPDAGADDVIVLLRKLGELRDAGILEHSEFEAKKAELLSRI